MPAKLSDHPWKIQYASDSGNPVADFYIPALERATQYDRKSGFFNSSILSQVAGGLGAMLHNSGPQQGQMRLIMGCQLSKADLAAIQQGYALRDAVAANLDASLTPPKNFAQLKRLEILSWLIQAGHLDIRIAIPLKRDGLPLDPDEAVDTNHIYHEKVCIFTDTAGNQLATSGSNNESSSGWNYNIESFHVFCSWEGPRDLARVQEEVVRFEELWNNITPNVRVFEVPDAVKRKLLRYAPPQKPTWQPQDEFNNRPLNPQGKQRIDKSQPDDTQPSEDGNNDDEPSSDSNGTVNEQEQFAIIAHIHQHPGCLAACLDSIPINPWPHQLKILRRAAAEFPRSFLIADEVGLGKTIETGLILRYLLVSQKAKRILVLAPASVQPQWHEELREKFNLHFWSYTKGEFKDPYGQTQPPLANPWNTKNLVLASSHLVRRQERMDELLEAQPWDLVVLDEAHHARRKSPQARKDTPNRLLELLGRLRNRTRALILLSATPMQIDPIEVFDLLHVLGLEGHWAYGDQFCEYFASLSLHPTGQLLKFWQTMSEDYFNQGGTLCPRLQDHLRQQNRMLASQVEDVWKGRIQLVNERRYLQDEDFINTSRQFLATHTPLKDMMFRHTRDTLRQYYRLGLLDRDVPHRQVIDHAITLEPDREADLYRQVSDYVRHFYRLAQQEQRRALGFLMTLYRKRLTSSFYAMEQSLRRRLEALLDQSGSGLTDDDLTELDDADDAIIEGLESYMEPVDPREIEYLESVLQQFENTGEDSKLAYLIDLLRLEFIERESVIVFTQYTDTMDFLKEIMFKTYGSQVACYSGRGGELWRDQQWTTVRKEEIKTRFRDGEIKILLCTESASEGLNLQTCGVLINYDMPWNPMRVEQRIGRIDRIGQNYPDVRIHNFYYDGTVEAKVYSRLRDRIDAFASVVGNLQPILAQVPTFIEQATMSVDPEEEDVLLANFDNVLDTPPLRPDLEDMVRMDVEADVRELQAPMPPAPVTSAEIETLFTHSQHLQNRGVLFQQLEPSIYELTWQEKTYKVTFDPTIFDDNPSLRLMAWGEPLFDQLLQSL
ncbi:helicase-related protein [Leptothoe kymatousa]|uniref:DEAD/DEAH box helicase family protein n=1 Tax=Leptothoe kymatousa TAU-MAC 1615 TaxID=2364775 RepID=A0ABS5Y7D9_9CYAN|nr:helicase-related protein [Leptothoe kymatousa]MBT9313789.1 DEAD/DEAH box helicase family protein [Leptothoe kymatousa TAU-MAC 1615]